MANILYCRVGWMNYYQGMKNDTISGGEKYLREHKIGLEIYNFQFINGSYYGFVEPGRNKGVDCRIHVERIGGTLKEGIAHDILVIWVADKKIVGWYKEADVYSTKQRVPQTVMESRENKEACEYNIKANQAVLIPSNKRNHGIFGMGQREFWYGDNKTNQDVTDYIKKYTEEQDESIKNITNTEQIKGEELWKYCKQRGNQDIFRNALLKKYNHCCLCGVSMESCLIASHIKPWKDSTPEEKLDVNNGLLLCPNHDKLFDTGLISFDETGRIIISPHLTEQTRINMNVDRHMRIQLTDMNAFYLAYHRDHIYQK